MTLFYGPEQHESNEGVVYCVFNVKKRSWKGGVQVVVELSRCQVADIRKCFQVDGWLQASLAHLSPPERKDYFERGQDIVIQQLCLLKLQLAIEVGIRQENSRIAHDILVSELGETLKKEETAMKEEVLLELDIELPA